MSTEIQRQALARDQLLRLMADIIAIEDRDRAELREAARDEMVPR